MKKFAFVVVATASVLSVCLSAQAAGRRSQCSCARGAAVVAPAAPAISGQKAEGTTAVAPEQATNEKFSNVKTSTVSESDEQAAPATPSTVTTGAAIQSYSVPSTTRKNVDNRYDAGWKIRTGGVAH